MRNAVSVPSLPNFRSSELRAIAPGILQACLAIGLVVQAGRLLWMLLAPVERPTVTTTVPAAATAPVPALATYPDPFFPRATDGAGATGFTLLGVRVAESGGSAILSNGGKQASYAIGDAVASGITLIAVGAGHVLLRAGGRQHRIALDQGSASDMPAPHPLPVAAPPPPREPEKPVIAPGKRTR